VEEGALRGTILEKVRNNKGILPVFLKPNRDAKTSASSGERVI